MAGNDDAVRLAAIVGDVLFGPGESFCYIVYMRWVFYAWGEPVAGDHCGDAVSGESFAYQSVGFAIATGP